MAPPTRARATRERAVRSQTGLSALESLPEECALLVFEACADRLATPFDGRDASVLLFNRSRLQRLRPLCLLCTRLLPAAQSVLYDTIGGLTLRGSAQLLRTFDEAPALLRYVRRLGIGLKAEDEDEDDAYYAIWGSDAVRLLGGFERLVHLEIWTPDVDAMIDLVARSLVMPRVTRLDISLNASLWVDRRVVEAILHLLAMVAPDVEAVRFGQSDSAYGEHKASSGWTIPIPVMPRLRHVHWHGGPDGVIDALLRSARGPISLHSQATLPDVSSEAAGSRVDALDIYMSPRDHLYGNPPGPIVARLTPFNALDKFNAMDFEVDLRMLQALPTSLRVLGIGGGVGSLAAARSFVADHARSPALQTVLVAQSPSGRARTDGREEGETARRSLEAACEARGIAIEHRSVE